MRLAILSLAALILASSPALAQTKGKTPAGPQPAIACISTREVLTGCEAGKRIVAEIQALFVERQERLARQAQEVRDLQDAIRGAKTRGPKTIEMETKRKRLEEEQDRLRRDVAREEEARLGPLVDICDRIVREYAREKGLAAIHDRDGLVYSDPALDITREIIARVNQSG